MGHIFHSDAEPAYVLPDSQTGKTAAHKLDELQETLAHQGRWAHYYGCRLCELAIQFRGKDLANTPFHLCFAFVPQQGRPTLIEGDYDKLTSVSGHPFASLPAGHYSIDLQSLPMALYNQMSREDVVFTEEAVRFTCQKR